MNTLEFYTTIESKTGFYIGDICYVLPHDIYNNIWGGNNYEDGTYEANGNRFCMGSTEFGDGLYYDQFGHSYGVDAGVIGCVPFELLDQETIMQNYGYMCSNKTLESVLCELGIFIPGDTAVFYSSGEGEMQIVIYCNGKVISARHIDTRELAEDDEYDEEEYYNDEEE